MDDQDAIAPASPAPKPSGGATAAYALSVILPARNEEAVIGDCLNTLLAQNAPGFALGEDWEILVVNDGSADRTGAIASGLLGAQAGTDLLTPPALDSRLFTGKNNACWFAASRAKGKWLLFTDADTLHEPGNLRRAVREAEKHGAAMLSYSPRQIISGVAQHLLMPLIFSELVSVYPPEQVNNPDNRLAAANGQFLMVNSDVYFAIGGHARVGRSVLEDVDLAWNLKRSKHLLRFRYAPDALSTRMYRGFSDMVEGWTKNLALLFPHALSLAAWRSLDVVLLLLPALFFRTHPFSAIQSVALWAIWGRTVFRFYNRVWRSKFAIRDCLIAPAGVPLFVFLLLRSWFKVRLSHQVTWKGREYHV